MLIGYMRVSSDSDRQSTDLQRDALLAAGIDAKGDRTGLARALEFVPPGDVLVVWKLDRLGRSLSHLLAIVNSLKDKQVAFRSLTEGMDTTTPSGELLFFHKSVYERLPNVARKRLDALLRPESIVDGSEDTEPGSESAVLLKLLGSPGRPSLASMQDELAKLELIRGIGLPAGLFEHSSPRDLERCRQRVSVEVPRELRRHPDAARMTWLAAFVHLRARTLTDDMVDLLIDTVHRIGARAERKVEKELLEDLKRVSGKQNLLFNLADATLAQPDGVVQRRGLPSRRGANAARSGEGVEGYRPDLPDHLAHRDPEFISRSLPPHGPGPAGGPGIPLQQRPSPSGDGCARLGEEICRHQGAYLSGRGECSA
jgi:hypothetical protein